MSSATNGTTVVASFPEIPVGSTLGAWLMGVSINLLLNGILFHQMYQYFHLYAEDRALLKGWVTSVVILETFVSALVLHTAYFYLVQMYWDNTYFFTQKTVWSINLLPIPGSIAALLSQTFFVRRVWIIAPKFKFVVGAAFILMSGNVACFTVLSYKMFNAANFTDWLKFSWLASVGSSIQMAGDIILSVTLIHMLRTSRTGINKTDSMLEVLIAYSISTGAINCVVHVLNVGFSIAMPDNFIYAALSVILTKLYANSFLVALNTRKFLGGSSKSNTTTGPYGVSVNVSGNGPRSPRGNNVVNMNMPMSVTNTTPTAIELKVVTEMTYDEDMDHLRSKRSAPSHDQSMA